MYKLTLLSAATVAVASVGSTMEQPSTSSEIPPARDGNIAIKEELCAARKKGTVEAYDLFIARHPQHPLAEQARQERARILSARGRS